MRCEEVIKRLKSLANPDALEGMARYGIATDKAFGVSVPNLRALAKELGTDHDLAGQLWASGIHDARILASMVDDARLLTEDQMERWAGDFNSWDLCDQCCMNLFQKTPLGWNKAIEWSCREEEFVKRAGFVLMARFAVSDKKAGDDQFEAYLPIIIREAGDERNMVKKAVNWALRQIGKRNLSLNARAIETAETLQQMDSRSARWIASDALRELRSESIQIRLKRQAACG